MARVSGEMVSTVMPGVTRDSAGIEKNNPLQ